MKVFWAAAAFACATGLATAYAVAGPHGLDIAATVAAAAGLLAGRLMTRAGRHPLGGRGGPARGPDPGQPHRAGRGRPYRGGRGRPYRGGRGRPYRPDPDEFPAYRRIAGGLAAASMSRRHYDYVTRPMLARLFAAMLSERHRVDAAAHPAAAARLVGDDVWPLVDPAAPRSEDSNAPGFGYDTLRRITSRLENL